VDVASHVKGAESQAGGAPPAAAQPMEASVPPSTNRSKPMRAVGRRPIGAPASLTQEMINKYNLNTPASQPANPFDRIPAILSNAYRRRLMQPINGYIANLIQHMKALPQPIPVSVPGTSPRAAVRVTGPAPSSGPQATMHPVARPVSSQQIPKLSSTTNQPIPKPIVTRNSQPEPPPSGSSTSQPPNRIGMPLPPGVIPMA